LSSDLFNNSYHVQSVNWLLIPPKKDAKRVRIINVIFSIIQTIINYFHTGVIMNEYIDQISMYIVLASALALVQFWVIPFLLNIKNLQWQFSNQDEALDDSLMLQRARRAGKNILETLPIFLVFCVLSIAVNIDVSQPACYWLIFRVVHGVSYMFGIIYLRTLAWLSALGCLIFMGFLLAS
jgi:uncharacterized MAPEG superfamily protein